MSRVRFKNTRASALSHAEREVFTLDLVAFQLEELNGLGDQLAFALESDAPDTADKIERMHTRARSILEGLSWDRPRVARAVWALLERALPPPEDLLGPVVLLAALGEKEARLADLQRRIPEERRRLSRLLLCTETDH